VFKCTAAQLGDTYAKRLMCFRCYKLDTLSHIINLSRDSSDAHIDLSRMVLRDTVSNAKSHSLEPMTRFLGGLEGGANMRTLQASFWKKEDHDSDSVHFE